MTRSRVPGAAGQMVLLLIISLAGIGIARFAADDPLPLSYSWSTHVVDSAAELGMTTVSAAEAKSITDAYSHLVLDARKHTDYQAGRIPGALSLPVTDFDAHFPSIAPLLTADFPVMVYCSGLECDESIELGRVLIESGFTNIWLFAGGMTEWTNAGFTVER